MSPTNKPPLFMNRASPTTGVLFKALLPHATVQRYPAGTRFPFTVDNIPTCYLIVDGTTEFHRGPDGLVISRIYPPAIAGIVDAPLSTFRECWIEAVEPCEVGVIDVRVAYNIVRENNLWEVLVDHLNGLFGKLYYYTLQSSSPSAYTIIRYQLMELATETEEFRAGITIEKYVRSRTTLSRSGIMKILAGLKTGGYVEMHEGKLVKINKLPAGY